MIVLRLTNLLYVFLHHFFIKALLTSLALAMGKLFCMDLLPGHLYPEGIVVRISRETADEVDNSVPHFYSHSWDLTRGPW